MTSELVNPVSLPPGPKGHFLFGTFGEYVRDPLGYLSQCAKEYGDIVYFPSVRFTGLRMYFLNHPDYIQDLRNCHKRWCNIAALNAKKLNDKQRNIWALQLLN